jgi:hypothetical protein
MAWPYYASKVEAELLINAHYVATIIVPDTGQTFGAANTS